MKQKLRAAWKKWTELPLSIRISWIVLDFVFLVMLASFPLFTTILAMLAGVIISSINIVDWLIDGSRRREHYRNLKNKPREDDCYDF